MVDGLDRVAATETAARAGDPQAQHEFARMLMNGKAVQRDLGAARAWFARAAEQGYPPAQNDFGSMLLNGLGGAQDGEAAVHWYRLAAEAGCPVAQFNLAQRYLHGSYVERDDAQALYWGKRAAASGHAEANTLVGNCYRFGRGVQPDLVRAVRLYILGARGGDPVAHGNLASCRVELEAQAMAGCPVAMLLTAILHAGGLGGDRDHPRAMAWLDLLDDLDTTALSPDDAQERRHLREALDDWLDGAGRTRAASILRMLRELRAAAVRGREISRGGSSAPRCGKVSRSGKGV